LNYLLTRPDGRSVKLDCAYNVFRNRERPEILCAVPEDGSVPSFLNAQAWSFECKLDRSTAAPPGFHERAARIGVRFNGFYLFQITASERRRVTKVFSTIVADPAAPCACRPRTTRLNDNVVRPLGSEVG
jgi:hypothetical protein